MPEGSGSADIVPVAVGATTVNWEAKCTQLEKQVKTDLKNTKIIQKLVIIYKFHFRYRFLNKCLS